MRVRFLTASIASFTLVFCASSAVFADDTPKAITTAEEFITYATDGSDDVVKLSNSITICQDVTITKKFDLDLNGYQVSLGEFFITADDDFIVRDTSADKNGVITNTKYFPVQIGSDTNHDATFTLESGKISGERYGIENHGAITINGGALEAYSYAIWGDGSIVMNGGKVTSDDVPTISITGANASLLLEDGEIVSEGEDQAVNLSNGASMVMNGGLISAAKPTGVGISAYRDTDTTINGGTIIAYEQV